YTAALYTLPLRSLCSSVHPPHLPSFPTRRSSDLPEREPALAGRHRGGRAARGAARHERRIPRVAHRAVGGVLVRRAHGELVAIRSEEHTSELQSRENLVCRLLLEKKKKNEDAKTP